MVTVKEKVAPFAEIHQCQETGSRSLHSTVEFTRGQVVVSELRAKVTYPTPNHLTLQVSDDQHIMFDPEFVHCINHSCDPNVFFDPHAGTVTALHDIAAGAEFTFFYPSTEWSMAQAFDCNCCSDNCLPRIQGAAHLPVEVLRKYRLSQYIEAKLAD